jgi:alpha-L-rhamnosidase
VWYPEGNASLSAPPGTRYFRKPVVLPAEGAIKRARFIGTADNSFELFINGKKAGHGDDSPEGWRSPVELEVTSFLNPGRNLLALSAVNATDQPSPAGVLGRLVVEFDRGQPLSVPVDGTWKAANQPADRWIEAGFDDSAWPLAKVVAPFGRGPWGRLGGRALTLSPAKADPFDGHCDLPPGLNLATTRVYLEVTDLAPEAAARVTVNGRYAGGFIGQPLRLDITRHLQRGQNTLRLEPFAPESVRLVAYPK